MNTPMNIGEAAKAAGVSAKMIRNYEQIGLLPPAERSDSGYRLYGPRDVSVLRFIRQSRRLGFSMEQIAELIGMWGDDTRSSREVKAVAQRHLDDLEEKMREITEMKDALQHLVSACKGDDHPTCAILDNLAVNSPTVPQHSATLNKAKHKRGERVASPPDTHSSESGSHIDLMAWMHGAASAHAR